MHACESLLSFSLGVLFSPILQEVTDTSFEEDINKAHQHAIAKFNECSALDWNVQVCNVVQHEIDEGFQLVLSKECLQALLCNQFAALVSNEAILCKQIIICMDAFQEEQEGGVSIHPLNN